MLWTGRAYSVEQVGHLPALIEEDVRALSRRDGDAPAADQGHLRGVLRPRPFAGGTTYNISVSPYIRNELAHIYKTNTLGIGHRHLLNLRRCV